MPKRERQPNAGCNAARQRNLIVHLYMEIDDRAVFASLSYLDDLREFATAVERLANSH